MITDNYWSWDSPKKIPIRGILKILITKPINYWDAMLHKLYYFYSFQQMLDSSVTYSCNKSGFKLTLLQLKTKACGAIECAALDSRIESFFFRVEIKNHKSKFQSLRKANMQRRQLKNEIFERKIFSRIDRYFRLMCINNLKVFPTI